MKYPNILYIHSEDARYCLPPAPLPDAPQTRQDMAAFKASARVLDRAIGTVLDALDANGLAENTLVISTTDHGIAFPGMKCNLTDHRFGVMLIVRGPGGFSGGQVCDALVSHPKLPAPVPGASALDLFPTICELLEIDRPAWLQGRSTLPLIRGEEGEINDRRDRAIFAEVTYHAAYGPQPVPRRWKYIRRFEHRPGPVLPNCDDSPSKDVWLEHGWRDHIPALEQLYDLIFDPNESHNLAGDTAVAGVLAQMRGRLEEWMQATDDPLLRGPVPAPPGAQVNDPGGLSPREPTRIAD